MSESQTTADELAWLFADSPSPIYVLDDRRRIVYCNPACIRWVDLSAAELLGQTCVYHALPATAASSAAVAASLCPPPKAFSGQPLVAWVSRTAPDGTLIYRRGHFLPLGDGQDESAPVIAILEGADCPDPLDEPADGAAKDAQLHELVHRFRQQMAARFGSDTLIGANPAIVRARTQIELAARTSASVLIVGPRGAGKEHAAKAIHYAGGEGGALVPLACAAVEPNLLRSTLRALWIRNAASTHPCGTLLLGNADCMPEEVQSDLAEMLRTGALRMRMIATAAEPLTALAAQGRFSAELACGLSTLTIELPALIHRLDDLPLLAQALLEEANAGSSKQLGGFTSEALDRLAAYSWPGNLDELALIVRQVCELAHGGEATADDLPERIRWAADADAHPQRGDEAIVLEDFLARVEKELVTRAMRRAKGNKSKAAKLLGMTRPRLYRRLVQLGLEPPAGGGP